MKYYLVIVVEDVDPEIHGPFETELFRDNFAIRHKREHGDEDGIFPLDIPEQGEPAIFAYSGGFFQDNIER